MNYYTRLKVFKSKRCEFDPHNMLAYSYGWWQFVACIRGKVYFNNARYSMQTGKQQAIIRGLLNQMGVKYTTVYIRAGLTHSQLQTEIDNTQRTILELQDAINKPRSRAETNKWRAKQIKYLAKHIKEVKALKRASRSKPYKGPLDLSQIPKRKKYAPRPKPVYQVLNVVNGERYFPAKSTAVLRLVK